MVFDSSLDDILLFELPDRLLAERLLIHVAPNRLAWLQSADGAPVVCVLLNSDRLDLALLLRAVQGWLEEAGLAAIRFEVDGRVYALDASRTAAVAG